ncbi:amidase domain-containing protein [Thalassobacillus hwangdonensis]|uniref:Amidase domain-containing protein n=1 Tax=Thalassobacillus hwangdonensis TaxID=546108 RepID=A0ABW3KWU4_9BACI
MITGAELKSHWYKTLSSPERIRTIHFLDEKWKLHKRRGYRIVRVAGEIKPYQMMRSAYTPQRMRYILRLSFVIKKDEAFYVEEQEVECETFFEEGSYTHHFIEEAVSERDEGMKYERIPLGEAEDLRFDYDRRSAVRYAERWWNSYNPEYQHFENDCTNYISQCLRAGGAPPWGHHNRSKGWWYSGKSWSFSWTVANAMRWYLSGSRQGLTGKEVSSPEELVPGDVICYDFEGDGTWNHTTMVIMKDTDGMPLVNAHTTNSRHRYWSYEDSTAYTPYIQYKFFRIGE